MFEKGGPEGAFSGAALVIAIKNLLSEVTHTFMGRCALSDLFRFREAQVVEFAGGTLPIK